MLRLNDLIKTGTGKNKSVFKRSQEIMGDLLYGDKVIQRKNNYELGVMNGDQGIIKESIKI